MNRLFPARLKWIVLLFVSLTGLDHAAAEETTSPTRDALLKKPADLLPASTALYAEVPDAKKVVDLLLEHPLRARLESLPQYQAALEQPNVLQFKAGVAVLEAAVGMPWPKLVATLTEGGVCLGFDPATGGVAVVARGRDAESLTNLRETLIRLARQDAERKGNENPVKTQKYRGLYAYQVGEARIATLDRWLIVTNKDKLAQGMLDAYLDEDADRLSSHKGFQTALERRPKEATAWGYVDVKKIRSLDEDSELFRGPRDNPVLEVLIGGIVGVLKRSPTASVSVNVESEKLQFELAMPYDPQWVTPDRGYYFGPKGRGQAPKPIVLKNQILSVVTYRNLSEMWLRADDLFDQQVTDGLAEADSNLATLFSGKDFGEEVLGAVQPGLQLIVARQTFDDDALKPSIKIPSFAIVAKLKQPEAIRKDLRRIYMNLVGFLNIIGAMNGQPQLDIDFEGSGKKGMITASYAATPEDKESSVVPINYNFSPTLAFHGPLLVISSTQKLAREVTRAIEEADGTESLASNGQTNTIVRINVPSVRDALADNRAQLVAQNMLDNGHTKDEAETEIGLILELLGLIQNADVRLETEAGWMRLRSSVEVSP